MQKKEKRKKNLKNIVQLIPFLQARVQIIILPATLSIWGSNVDQSLSPSPWPFPLRSQSSTLCRAVDVMRCHVMRRAKVELRGSQQ